MEKRGIFGTFATIFFDVRARTGYDMSHPRVDRCEMIDKGKDGVRHMGLQLDVSRSRLDAVEIGI